MNADNNVQVNVVAERLAIMFTQEEIPKLQSERGPGMMNEVVNSSGLLRDDLTEASPGSIEFIKRYPGIMRDAVIAALQKRAEKQQERESSRNIATMQALQASEESHSPSEGLPDLSS